MGNPFTVADLPGRATRTVSVTPAQTPALASPTGSVSESNDGSTRDVGGLSTGAKAGFGVGIGVGTILIAVAAILIARNKRRTTPTSKIGDAEKRISSPFELHDDEAQIHHIASTAVEPMMELEGCEAGEGRRHELGVRASTWLVELPVDKSSRNSRQRA